MLDTLQHGLTHCKDIIGDDLDKKKIVMLMINIIRLSEKVNDRGSTIIRSPPSNILQVLGISDEELNQFEFPVFQSMGFKVELFIYIIDSCH